MKSDTSRIAPSSTDADTTGQSHPQAPEAPTECVCRPRIVRTADTNLTYRATCSCRNEYQIYLQWQIDGRDVPGAIDEYFSPAKYNGKQLSCVVTTRDTNGYTTTAIITEPLTGNTASYVGRSVVWFASLLKRPGKVAENMA